MSALTHLVDRLPASAASALRRWRRPRHEFAVRSDLKRTWHEVAFLRNAEPPEAAPDRHALLLALSESVYGSKLLGMLGSGLRLDGWRVTVLVRNRRSSRSGAYLRAYGLDDVVGFDEFGVPDEDLLRCRDAADLLLQEPISFREAKRWTFDGALVGQHVLSTVSRRATRGAPDLSDPAVRVELERVLPEVLWGVHRSQAVVSRLNPDLVVVNEANYAEHGVLVDAAVASGADVVQFTQPWRDDALMCRRLTPVTRREHPSTLAKASLHHLCGEPWGDKQEAELEDEFRKRYGDEWFLQSRNQPYATEVSNDELRERLGLRANRPLVVVFSHVLWDANLFYGDDLFEDYGDWFVETVRAAVANEEADWIIKFHPANLWKRRYERLNGQYSETMLIGEKVGSLPPHVHIMLPDTDISSLSLYRHGDVGVTVRGTPGMEMPCFGKPVVTAGTGRYSGLGFTVDPPTKEAYLEMLARVQELPPLSAHATMLAKRHADAVFRRRHWQMRSFQPEFEYQQQGSHPLDHNLRPRVRSLQELEAEGDLARWVRWAGTAEIDYLET